MVISGIIRPPPDIRAVADRTALFVSKNGRAFEVKILNSAKGKTPKFFFLQASSPFHGYYEDRIRFYDEGGTDEEEKKKEEEEKLKRQRACEEEEQRALKEKEAEAAAAKKEAARKSKASAVDPVARALLVSRSRIEDARKVTASASKGGEHTLAEGQGREGAESSIGTVPTPPPPLRHVSLLAPANVTPLEVEVIKLTAQYVALSEKKDSAEGPDNFLRNLTIKEWANPEFAFLQPRHGNFAYFTALVDCYRSFLPGGEDCERAQNKARMDAKKERLAHLMDDSKDKPKTKKDVMQEQECLEQAAYRTEYEREKSERRREAAAEGADGIGGAGTVDWHDFVVVETIEFAVDEVVEELPAPTSLRLAALNREQLSPEKIRKKEDEGIGEKQEEIEESSSDEDIEMEEDEEEGEKLKVVSAYQPKVVSTKEITGDASRTHIIDPITGKSVAMADMTEHMRIQLLDPKWAEERRRFLEKQRETNFVAGNDIASNISRFAQARGVISSEAEIHDPKADSDRRFEANFLIREQSMLAQPVALSVMPPPSPVNPPVFTQPTFVSAPPPPPPPPQQVISQQPRMSLEEPPAKRLKNDESQVSNAPIPMPPPALPAPPGLPEAPGMATTPLPLQPPSEDQALSESDFIATLSNPDKVPVCIRVPHDLSNSNWNFNGQTIDLMVKATSRIKDLKDMLKDQLGGMPANKMQFKHPSSGFMNKDGLSMAHFNVGPMTTLDLIPKTRGGRK